MRKEMSCDKCSGTGRLTTKELPFEVGDRVVGTMIHGKPAGVIILVIILPWLTGKIRSSLEDGYHSNNIYVIKFDDGTYRHMGENVLGFEGE